MLATTFATFVCAATVALAQFLPEPGQLVKILDFQGNVFDLADRNTAEFTPVQTLNHKLTETAQQWFLEGSTKPGFTILSSQFTTLSNIAALVNAGDHKCAQLCGENVGVNTLWNITLNAAFGGFNILEMSSGLAVTSWLALTSPVVTPSTPLTLQLWDPKVKEQVFTFAPCKSIKFLASSSFLTDGGVN
ncbi:hypothetical protein K438DRAFT_1974792 [Mycena galopus ATCC 62051]|nr:hypothetical protein K438DRAFT_1974792 [Mycena galopus ATCC 62051]